MSALYVVPSMPAVDPHKAHLVMLGSFAPLIPRSQRDMDRACILLYPTSPSCLTIGYVSRIELPSVYQYGIALASGNGWVPVLDEGQRGEETALTEALERSKLFALPTLAMQAAGILPQNYLQIMEGPNG